MGTDPEITVLYTQAEIEARVAAMAAQIDRDFHGQPLILIGVLKGATIFMSDLARKITLNADFDFIGVASYSKGTKSTGEVRVTKDLDQSVAGRNVILVEDILDTGLTLSYLKNVVLTHQPKSLAVAALLDKPSRRVQPMRAEYVGFTIADVFVVGYGMDFEERYRNLPDICTLNFGV